jgi:hypothetical protein
VRRRWLLLLIAVAAVVEAVAVRYWIDNAGFDCYPSCDTGQVVSGWTAAILPLLVLTVLIASVVRWLLSRRGSDAGPERPELDSNQRPTP